MAPTLAWASGPTLGRLHLASSKGTIGRGWRAPASSASNTSRGVRPSRARGVLRPATSVHQRRASATIAANEAKSRPAKKLRLM